MVLVKLVQPGRETREFEVSNNPTVGGLLRLANITYVSGSVIRSHNSLGEGAPLYDGDVIMYATPTKGNVGIEVKVIFLGSQILTIPAESGMTIDDVLQRLPTEQKAKLADGNGRPVYEYRIGDSDALAGSYVINGSEGQVIRLVLSSRTKGNE
jgi:hypothetical protein